MVLQSRLLPHCSVELKNVGRQVDSRQASPFGQSLSSLQVLISLHWCFESHTSLLEHAAKHSSGWTQLLLFPTSLQTFRTLWVSSQSLLITHWCDTRSVELRQVPCPTPGPIWSDPSFCASVNIYLPHPSFISFLAHQQNSPALQSLLDLQGWETTHLCSWLQISFSVHWDIHW